MARLREEYAEEAWPGAAGAGAAAANDSWSADFKGWFRTGDGTRCEPLTISDNYSRYLITCHALPRLTFALVRPHLERAFREHGLPRAIRTDNGTPFAHRLGLGGLTQLSVWLFTLDVWPDRITPGRRIRMVATSGCTVHWRKTPPRRRLTPWLSNRSGSTAGAGSTISNALTRP